MKRSILTVAGLLCLPVAIVLYVLLHRNRAPRYPRVVPAWVEW